jgi:hypothetical protein
MGVNARLIDGFQEDTGAAASYSFDGGKVEVRLLKDATG